MNISICGWDDRLDNIRCKIIYDVINIMYRYFNNEILFRNDLIIYNIKSLDCLCAGEDPCTHYDRSHICLNVDGAHWCQFVHQLSHELCHCSTSRTQLPQNIKWFDEFICCCSSYLVELIISQETSGLYNYMFGESTSKNFADYLLIEEKEHIYCVDSIRTFFKYNRKGYESDQNLIKKHDFYCVELFNKLNNNFNGLTFVGKMHLVQLFDCMNIEQFITALKAICDEKENNVINQIIDVFGIKI